MALFFFFFFFSIAVGASETTTCSSSCNEGNLDLQYLMGVAQGTATIYWYVAGTNPFISWALDVADESDPPKANSISWGSIEQVGYLIVPSLDEI